MTTNNDDNGKQDWKAVSGDTELAYLSSNLNTHIQKLSVMGFSCDLVLGRRRQEDAWGSLTNQPHLVVRPVRAPASKIKGGD